MQAETVQAGTIQAGMGWVAAAVSEAGVVGVCLPEASPEAARRRLLRLLPPDRQTRLGWEEPAPGSLLDRVLQTVAAYYRSGDPGAFAELAAFPLDLTAVPAFSRRVLEAARRIPPGQVRTYGQLAREVGRPGAARAVGQAMARNPVCPLVPCHRVVGADGSLTGFGGGLALKRRMLALEGFEPET